MAAIRIRDRTSRRTVLAVEDFLAAPSVAVPSSACSLIAAPPAARRRRKHRPVDPWGQGAGYPGPPARRTGEITGKVASGHGPLDAPGPAAGGAGGASTGLFPP